MPEAFFNFIRNELLPYCTQITAAELWKNIYEGIQFIGLVSRIKRFETAGKLEQAIYAQLKKSMSNLDAAAYARDFMFFLCACSSFYMDEPTARHICDIVAYIVR